MVSRSLLLAVLSLAMIGMSASMPGQTKTNPGTTAKAPTPPTTSTVYYRSRGAKTWSLFGYYRSEGSARQVFEHLARTGYEVELRISNTPIPKVDPPPKTAQLPIAETVTYQRAVDVFNTMARQGDIAYRFPADGCYARAQLMIERMQRAGAKPRRIWAVANGEELYARTKNHPRGYVTWGYHVAPLLRVRNGDGSQRWYVIDPALFGGPATVNQWTQAQMRDPKGSKPYLTLTRVGDAPIWVDKKRKPGSGYWPGTDPREGPREHALATMKKYKPWEGRTPPKGVVWTGPGSAFEERERTEGVSRLLTSSFDELRQQEDDASPVLFGSRTRYPFAVGFSGSLADR